MSAYFARIASQFGGVVTVDIGFGEPAGNSLLVPAALQAIAALQLQGGRGIRFDGSASLPVASALTHAVAHLYAFVAWFDPKLQRYVVAVSHDPTVRPGTLIDP